MSEFKWFLIALLVLWILWAASGGYSRRQENVGKPLLHEPAPINNWQPYGFRDR